MKRIPFFVLCIVFFCGPIKAGQHYSEECVKEFQNLVFDRLAEENRINVYHQIWFWVPGKVLQGEAPFSCTDWATKNGISSEHSESVEILSAACAELKAYSEKLVKEFECRQNAI